MKTSLALAAALFLCGLSAPAFAQTKIGYTNVELILAHMPESKVIEQALETLHQKLAHKLRVKEDFAREKHAEYTRLQQTLTPAQLAERERELARLSEEYERASSQAESDLAARRQALLDPVMEKLDAAITEVAKAGGYTVVLNQTTSGGVSTILYGPPEDDLTERIMAKLGVSLPKEER